MTNENIDKGKFNDMRQEIDIGKSPYGFYLDINGERILATEFLKDIFERMEKEVKKAFGIPEKKGGFFSKR